MLIKIYKYERLVVNNQEIIYYYKNILQILSPSYYFGNTTFQRDI